MSLLQKYRDYLVDPKASQVKNDITVCYVPTNTVFNGSVDVLKHLDALNTRAIRDDSKLLHVVEGTDSLCLETASSIEILHGGDVYTPQYKSSYVTPQTVTLPFVSVLFPTVVLPPSVLDSLTRLLCRSTSFSFRTA